MPQTAKSNVAMQCRESNNQEHPLGYDLKRGSAERVAVAGDRRVQAPSPIAAGTKAFVYAWDKLRERESSLISARSETERTLFRSVLMKTRNAHEGET